MFQDAETHTVYLPGISPHHVTSSLNSWLTATQFQRRALIRKYFDETDYITLVKKKKKNPFMAVILVKYFREKIHYRYNTHKYNGFHSLLILVLTNTILVCMVQWSFMVYLVLSVCSWRNHQQTLSTPRKTITPRMPGWCPWAPLPQG